MNASSVFKFGFVELLWLGSVCHTQNATQATCTPNSASAATGRGLSLAHQKNIKNKKD